MRRDEARLNEFPFDLTISNPAKSPNSIRAAHCYADSSRQPFCTEPVDLLMRKIDPRSSIGGTLNLPAQWVFAEDYGG